MSPQTTVQERQLQLLNHYDEFATSIRSTHRSLEFARPHPEPLYLRTTPGRIYRAIKFLPREKVTYMEDKFSGIGRIEQYIEGTKQIINENCQQILKHNSSNVTKAELKALKHLKQSRSKLTIKPADKNLGVVVLDTDDYIKQCMVLLSDTNTHRQAHAYPTEQIHQQVTNTLVNFKSQICNYNHKLYEYLQPKKKYQIPQLYGLPKIHKQFNHLPPLRPIISHCDSILNPTAHFLDHCLQPIAQSYPDYLHNSTTLSLTLQELHVPDDAFLVSIDVVSLYPSIPQTECLQTIYDQMHQRRHLLLLNPNLLIQLLHININYNYFEYGTLIFQQTHGTAMGTAFSPTIANIFMSVCIRKFLATQKIKPLLLKRYIDNIFLIWTNTKETLQNFLDSLNGFHPSIQFTYTISQNSTDFLDLSIYKGSGFQITNKLDTKTYQKQQNLYQYLHFSSEHTKNQHKAVITGECIRYIRTNTTEENYNATVFLFKQRLMKRDYPPMFIDKTIRSVSYRDRQRHLAKERHPEPYVKRPIFKCLPPPKFSNLKHIILQNYSSLHLPTLRFVTLGHRTLKKELLRSKIEPTDEQMVDMLLTLPQSTNYLHVVTGQYPAVTYPDVKTKPCGHSRCVTCTHLNCKSTFKSTKTGNVYPLRHSFTCTSRNIIYLITCSKCKKQYVGFTTQQLNVRINHHRTNIFNHVQTYISNHFNFPDHSIRDLTVQIIDTPEDGPNVHQKLKELERYWIKTLKTLRPLGLNVSSGLL